MLNDLQAFLHRGQNEPLVLVSLAALVLLLALGWLFLLLRVGRLERRIRALTRNADGASLEEAIKAHMLSVDDAMARMDTFEQAVGILQACVPACLQRVNVVRFDAFEDVGGEQSFAVALLDGRGDGVVLSSIYTRQDVRMYAKSITGGQPSHSLSREERKALEGSA